MNRRADANRPIYRLPQQTQSFGFPALPLPPALSPVSATAPNALRQPSSSSSLPPPELGRLDTSGTPSFDLPLVRFAYYLSFEWRYSSFQ